jgi:hypothetical protein
VIERVQPIYETRKVAVSILKLGFKTGVPATSFGWVIAQFYEVAVADNAKVVWSRAADFAVRQ